MPKSNLVVVGLRAKTGRAIAVVLSGSKASPLVISKTEIKLTDPKIPETFQPYHEVMEMSWDQGQKAVRTFTRPVEVVTRKALAMMIKELRTAGFAVKNVGIVGSKDRDLARIGNYHIRAHAAEGILFRSVLELAATASGVKIPSFSDRELDGTAASELGIQSADLTRRLNELGKPLTPPWRTDEKQAAVAAWIMLGE